MNPFDTTIVSLALQPLLVNRLQNIIYLHEKRLQIGEVEHDFATTDRSFRIPLNQIKTEDQTWYVSAIALKLAKLLGKPAIEVAHQITTDLIQSIEVAADAIDPLPLDRVWQNFTIQITPPGWIHLSLNRHGLAEWLQTLIRFGWHQDYRQVEDNTKNNNQVFRNSTHIFKIQHTHARCCSLLRLAEREHLIQLAAQPSSSTSPLWRITEPDPLPWFNQGKLQFEQGSEYRLIAEFMTVLDALSRYTCGEPLELPEQTAHDQTRQAEGQKVAIALCQAFYNFDAACRIVGESRSGNLALVQARLGLVALTRTLCAILLQDWLKLPAPLEL